MIALAQKTEPASLFIMRGGQLFDMFSTRLADLPCGHHRETEHELPDSPCPNEGKPWKRDGEPKSLG